MAGAGYKLFNTGDVLTAQQVNEYLQQQTVMVFASSAARTTALSGVLAEGMMSYLQDTNSVEVYNGSAWVGVASDQIPLTTKGDLLTYSTTDTRLPVGADGTYLQADSTTSTGLKWGTISAGAYTTLASGTLSGSNVSLTSISGSYVDLYLTVTNFYTNVGGELLFTINNSTGANYSMLSIRSDNVTSINNVSRTSFAPDGFNVGTPSTASNYTAYFKIPDYAKSSAFKAYELGWSGAKTFLTIGYNSSVTAAITSIEIRTGAGQTFSGGNYTLYGVK